jgi:ABC-type glycerol-3-phosphate transport system substrate-binding protein
MGGKGADIYAMDVLPYHKYAGSGSLTDLRYFMQADPEFDISNYRANIFEGVKFRGGQYVLPMDFHFELMIFDREKAGEEAAAKLRAKNEFTYWEMTDAVKERFAADESGAKIMDFLFIDDITRMVFNSLWMNNLNSYINREDNTVNFTDGKFAEFLTKYKEQADQNYFKSPLTEGEGNYIAGFADPNSQIGYYFKSMLSYQIKDSFVYDAMAATGKDVSMYSYTIKPNDERLGVLLNDNGQGAYEYYTGFAMNANSGNKKTAWEFIKLLLGEQMQTSIRLLGIPVNKTAYERYVKQNITESPNYIQGETEGEYTADGFIEIEEDREAREAALAGYTLYMEEILPKLTYAVIRDNTINDMVRGEFEAFLNGEKTAGEAAQELQNKVGMYLSE